MLRDAVYGVYGALRLARLDPAGVAFIGRDEAAALRSFWVLAVLIPGQMLLTLMTYWDRIPEGHLLPVLALKTATLLVRTFAVYLIVFHILEMTGRADRFAHYVGATNWGSVVQVAVVVPVVAVVQGNVLPTTYGEALGTVTFFWTLFYSGYIAAQTLGVGRMAAFGLVMLDFFVSQLIEGLADARIWGMPAG
ncbi:MAG TPA: hypothetical protein VEB20_01630 [Azospirillaceae bacterium]|nr:hypothetical protein [Azospirillaceae bacterium]